VPSAAIAGVARSRDLEEMTGYTTRAVAEILGMTEERVRSFAKAGLLAPARGPGNQLRFTFQDIVLLRAARELLERDVPARRVRAALISLRAQLPRGRPLSAVRIAAQGDRVIVREADAAWEPETGQMALDLAAEFSVGELAARVEPFAPDVSPGAPGEDVADHELTADDWYDLAIDLEAVSAAKARAAYARAIALDPGHAEAHLNLGRLLHEAGELAGAESHYRQACSARPDSALAAFNLGVALEDRGAAAEAIATYKRAVKLDPEHAESHFNLGRLYEAKGDASAALRHLAEYKRIRERGVG
jgi:tetratricopeptide (TPR) repeat protein